MKIKAAISIITPSTLVLKGEFPSDLRMGQVVEVNAKATSRTLNQNALYWLFCAYVGKELGMTSEDVHEACKHHLLLARKMVNGKQFTYTRSTSALSKGEFVDYFNRCVLLVSEYGVDTSGFWNDERKIYFAKLGENT